jgi:uncharacterized protein DUF6573
MSSLAPPLEMPLISTYTRQQAIEDGVLVDANDGELAEVTRQHFRVHVAMTAAVFAILEHALKSRRHSNDLRGVWHDVCWSLRITISRQPEDSSMPELLFRVIAGRTTCWTFKALMGPDDEGVPCLTIMLPEED